MCVCANLRKQSLGEIKEGGELDSQEEASPVQFKSREVVPGYRERDFFCFSCFPTAELRTLSL